MLGLLCDLSLKHFPCSVVVEVSSPKQHSGHVEPRRLDLELTVSSAYCRIEKWAGSKDSLSFSCTPVVFVDLGGAISSRLQFRYKFISKLAARQPKIKAVCTPSN